MQWCFLGVERRHKRSAALQGLHTPWILDNATIDIPYFVEPGIDTPEISTYQLFSDLRRKYCSILTPIIKARKWWIWISHGSTSAFTILSKRLGLGVDGFFMTLYLLSTTRRPPLPTRRAFPLAAASTRRSVA